MKNKFLLSTLLFFQFALFGQNIIENSNFSSGLDSWTSFVADFDGVSANIAEVNEEASITNIVLNGTNPQIWHVQLFQDFTPNQITALTIGQTYTASFKARSSVNGRALRFFFGENGGGFQAINMTDFSLTDQMATYEVSFNINNTYSAMKFGFEMGLNNEDVIIDDVQLTPGGSVNGVNIKFRVDMSDYNGTYTTPEVNGTFNGWCGNCNPMNNVSGDIWETTITLPEGTYEYKFSHDNWAGQEALTAGTSCTVTDGEYTNRVLVANEDVILPLVCWNACVSCELVSIDNQEFTTISIYPNPATDMIYVETEHPVNAFVIYDHAGKEIIKSDAQNSELNISISHIESGVYFIHLLTNYGVIARSFIK